MDEKNEENLEWKESDFNSESEDEDNEDEFFNRPMTYGEFKNIYMGYIEYGQYDIVKLGKEDMRRLHSLLNMRSKADHYLFNFEKIIVCGAFVVLFTFFVSNEFIGIDALLDSMGKLYQAIIKFISDL